MRYGLESTLPINAFSPRTKGPFARGMTLEGGGGGGSSNNGGKTDPIQTAVNAGSDLVQSAGSVLASVDPGPAISDAASAVGSAINSAAQNVGNFFANIDPGPAIGNLGRSLGTGLSEAGHAVGDLLSNGEKYIGQTLDSAGHWVDVTVDRLGNTIVHTLNSGAGAFGPGGVFDTGAQNLGQVGAHLDKAVNDTVPGGWGTIAGVAAIAAAPFVAPEFLASSDAISTAASAIDAGATPIEAAAQAGSVGGWTADSVLSGAQNLATAVGSGAAKGAGAGAVSSLIAGKDPLQGALKGAEMGGLTGGVGDLAQAADLGSAGTRLVQAAAPSLITGKDPTTALENAAMSLGAGAVGGELGLGNQASQTALSVGKALTAGGDPTNALLGSAIGSAVGATTNAFSSAFQDAIKNGMTPEQAYTIASQADSADAATASPTDTGGITGQTTDASGNTVYNYDDGSSLTVDSSGNVVDATQAPSYTDPGTAAADAKATGAYVDPGTASADANATGAYIDPNAPSTDTSGTSAGGALSTAAGNLPGQAQGALNSAITSAVKKAVLPTAAPLSKAIAAKTTALAKPVSTLAPIQSAANQILSGAAPAQATTGVMTPAERMAAIAKAFGGVAPVLTPTTTGSTVKPTSSLSPGVFASGGSVDYSSQFIDQQAQSAMPYMKPAISHGNAGYSMPGYPFGQLWRIGMAHGGTVGEHNPEFFSEGGLNSLDNTYVKGNGDGTSDSIPAMLANGEFVIPADVVSGLGNGSNDSGAKVLDEFLKTIREHKRKTGADKLPPDSKGPLGYLLEANKKVKK